MSRTTTVLIPDRVPQEMTTDLRAEILDRLPDLNVRRAADADESAALAPDADVVLTYGLGDEILENADGLEWVQALSAGVDGYDIDWLQDRGIVLTSASGVHGPPMAQHVFGCVFFFERNLGRARAQQRARAWNSFAGEEVTGKTLGIVGVGAIGGSVAELGECLGMEVVGTKRDTDVAPDAVDEIYSPDGLDSVLERADVLVVSCPLTDDTENLLGSEELARLDDDAVLVNVARGGIVDQDALVAALCRDELGAAALDVFEEEPLPEASPLWEFDNVLITPHMGGSSQLLVERKADLFAENYRRFRDGDDLLNRV